MRDHRPSRRSTPLSCYKVTSPDAIMVTCKLNYAICLCLLLRQQFFFFSFFPSPPLPSLPPSHRVSRAVEGRDNSFMAFLPKSTFSKVGVCIEQYQMNLQTDETLAPQNASDERDSSSPFMFYYDYYYYYQYCIAQTLLGSASLAPVHACIRIYMQKARALLEANRVFGRN